MSNRRIWILAIPLATLLSLTGFGSPAHASNPGSCQHATTLTFNVDEYTTPDGYTGVVHSQGFYFSPQTMGCDRPYEGENSQCATFRINILDSPSAPWNDGARGPWVRSCWSHQDMASGWGGWIHQGDGVVVEARAMSAGIVKGWTGHAYN